MERILSNQLLATRRLLMFMNVICKENKQANVHTYNENTNDQDCNKLLLSTLNLLYPHDTVTLMCQVCVRVEWGKVKGTSSVKDIY